MPKQEDKTTPNGRGLSPQEGAQGSPREAPYECARESAQPAWGPVVVALDIGGTKIGGAALLCPEDGSCPHILLHDTIKTQAHKGGSSVLTRVVEFAKSLVERSPAPVVGIGVGSAGRVDAKTGSIAYANEIIMPGWTGQRLGESLRQACGLPVAVLNDAQAHALGEARWGAGQGASTCIVIAAGTGIGGGLIAHRRIVRDQHGFAGELGATLQPLGSSVMGAAEHASLEAIASGSGIESCYAKLGGEALSGKEIAQRAEAGEKLASCVIEQAGKALGCALANWTNIFDPDLVILSGSVSKAGKVWHKSLEEGFREQVPAPQADLVFSEAALGDMAPLMGAAAFFLDQLEQEKLENDA